MYIKPSNFLQNSPTRSMTPLPVNLQGSFVSGRVLKWIGGQLATINIGGQVQNAQVEGNIKVGDRYVFQVLDGDETTPLHLKLIKNIEADKTPLPIQAFKQLGIPSNAGTRELISYMIQKGIPLTSSTIKELMSLTASVPQMKEALAILDDMLARNFPLHPDIFQAIAAVKRGPGTTVLLDRLTELLEMMPDDTNLGQVDSIKQLLHDLQQGDSYIGTFTSSAGLAPLFEKMGLFHEAMLSQFFRKTTMSGEDDAEPLPPQTLKGELLSLLSDKTHVPSNVAQTASLLLHHLTGEQLLSLTHDPNWFSLMVQVPIQAPNEKRQEAQVKWDIKKAPDGRLDPSFCRLVFHLHLTHLKETILQMVIQDRQVSCTLYSEVSSTLDLSSSPLYEEMKERLHNLSYNLVGFNHRPESLQMVKQQLFNPSTQMDVSI